MYTYASKGQQAVSVRDLAWGHVGENLSDSNLSVSEALSQAGLAGWNVRKTPLQAVQEDGSVVDVPNNFATLADIGGSTKSLGVVGNKYQCFQNEDTFNLVDSIIDAASAHVVAAGSVRDHKKVFILSQMPEGITVGGEDAHDLYLGATSTHDGSGALELFVTAVRVRCTNALDSAMRGAKSRWSIRHTRAISGRVEDARRELDLAFKWADEFQREAEILLNSPFSDAEWFRFLDQIAPESESEHEGWAKRQQEKRDTLTGLWHDDETNGYHGTRWGAWQAATEYADWYMPVKGADESGTKRAERIVDSVMLSNFKENALGLLLPA